MHFRIGYSTAPTQLSDKFCLLWVNQPQGNSNNYITCFQLQDWLPHIEAKHHHFLAVAEFRKSLDDIEYSRSGRK